MPSSRLKGRVHDRTIIAGTAKAVRDGVYVWFIRLGKSRAIVLGQDVQLGDASQAPTLSLMYSATGNLGAGDLQIVIDAGGNRTSFPLGLTGEGWQHAWLDLTAYGHQAITVGVQLTQQPNANPLLVNVDEMSLGSAAPEMRPLYLPVCRR